MLSLLSNEKPALPLEVDSARPLLAMLPSIQPWTSDVMSMSTNWLSADVVKAIECPPVADAPMDGAFE